MLMRIRGIVFRWSLRVWLTRLVYPVTQNSKLGETKRGLDLDNSWGMAVNCSSGITWVLGIEGSFLRNVTPDCVSIEDVEL
jgi:hypothetical protein